MNNSLSKTKGSSPSLQLLLLRGKKYGYSRGQIIQSYDDRQVFNLVTEGFVKRYLVANDGAIGVQSIYGPGDIFPLTSVFKALFNQSLYEGPEVYYYEAMSEVEMYTIDTKTLLEKVQEGPLLYRDLMLVAGRRLQSNIQQLENAALRNSYKRVAHQLYYLASQFGKKESAGTRITLPLTHQFIADTLSATRETVSIAMKQLRGKKLIKTGNFVTVLDMEKLKAEAYGET